MYSIIDGNLAGAFTVFIGQGILNHLESECNEMTPIHSQVIPTTDNAAEMYRTQGGKLTEFGLFGCDPLRDRADLIHRREVYFFSTHPTFEDNYI